MKFINRFAPNCITNNKITAYKNKKVGIDANLLIYKLVYAIRRNGYDIKNKNLIVTHIHAMLVKLLAFQKYNIKPIFVFDSLAPDIKLRTLEIRTEIKNKLIEKYKDSTTKEGKRIYYYVKSNLTDQEIEDCKDLIKLFGFNIIEAKEESDAELAYLSKTGYIDYIVSDDMDILLFGGKILLKNFTIDEKKYIQEIKLESLKKCLKFNQSQLIDSGILLGSDYCHNKKFPVVKTFNLLKEYGNLNNIPNNIFNTDCSKAIKYFENPPVTKINKIPKIVVSDKNKIAKMLEKFNFSSAYIDKVKKLIK